MTSKTGKKTKTTRPAPRLTAKSKVADVGSASPKPRVRKATVDQARSCAIQIARLLEDRHLTDILVLDIRGKSDLADYLVIASGTSNRQIRSVGEETTELAAKHTLDYFGRDVDGPTSWLVLDFVQVIVHLFEPFTRAHYDLEMLWGDASKVTWRRRSSPKKPAKASTKTSTKKKTNQA